MTDQPPNTGPPPDRFPNGVYGWGFAPDVDTLAESLGQVLTQYERAMHELGWTMVNVRAKDALSDLAARARLADERGETILTLVDDFRAEHDRADRLARRVAELESRVWTMRDALRQIEQAATSKSDSAFRSFARAALAGDGGGA